MLITNNKKPWLTRLNISPIHPVSDPDIRCGLLYTILHYRYLCTDNFLTNPLRRLPGACIISALKTKKLKARRDRYFLPENTDATMVGRAVRLTVILHLVKLAWLRIFAREDVIEFPELICSVPQINLEVRLLTTRYIFLIWPEQGPARFLNSQ